MENFTKEKEEKISETWALLFLVCKWGLRLFVGMGFILMVTAFYLGAEVPEQLKVKIARQNKIDLIQKEVIVALKKENAL